MATNFAYGEEVVGAIFNSEKGKRKEEVPVEGSKTKNLAKKPKRGKKGKKKGLLNQCTQGQEVDSDEAHAVTSDHKGPQGPPRGGGLFDDMLKKSCPYHRGTVKHTLEECDMLCKYFNCLGRKDEAKKKDEEDKGSDGFPSVENMFFIFGGPTKNMTTRQHK